MVRPLVERAVARARNCDSENLYPAAAAVPRRFSPASLLPAWRPPHAARPRAPVNPRPRLPLTLVLFRLGGGVPGGDSWGRAGDKQRRKTSCCVQAGCSPSAGRQAAIGGAQLGEPGPANLRAISAGPRRRGQDGRRFGLGWKWGLVLRALYRGLLGASLPGLMNHDLVSIRGLVRATQ